MITTEIIFIRFYYYHVESLLVQVLRLLKANILGVLFYFNEIALNMSENVLIFTKHKNIFTYIKSKLDQIVFNSKENCSCQIMSSNVGNCVGSSLIIILKRLTLSFNNKIFKNLYILKITILYIVLYNGFLYRQNI